MAGRAYQLHGAPGRDRQLGRFAALGFGEDKLDPVDAAGCAPQEMPQVLAKLSQLSPLLKRPLLGACTDCVLDDGLVTVSEAELIRAIAESLDCPMPPLVAKAA